MAAEALKWIFLVILLSICSKGDCSSTIKKREPSLKHSSGTSGTENVIFSSANDDVNEKNNLMSDNNNVDGMKNCDCSLMGFGIVQKIPYYTQRSNPMDVTFSSACVRCGLCLVIADKINKTLMDVHDANMSSDRTLNMTEADDLFQMICNKSFARYRLREINGDKYIGESLPGSTLVESTANGLWGLNLKNKCNEILDEICPFKLYKLWQDWHNGVDQNFTTILCHGDVGALRDCRSINDAASDLIDKQNSFNSGVQLKVTYDCAV